MFFSDASLHRFDRSDQKNQNSRTATVPPRGCRVKQTVSYLFTMSKYPVMDASQHQHNQTLLLSLTRLCTWRRSTGNPRSKSIPNQVWWSQTGSNRRHPACKAGALPAELWPHHGCHQLKDMVGPGRLELPTSRLSGVRSNHLSYGPQASAWTETCRLRAVSRFSISTDRDRRKLRASRYT